MMKRQRRAIIKACYSKFTRYFVEILYKGARSSIVHFDKAIYLHYVSLFDSWSNYLSF